MSVRVKESFTTTLCSTCHWATLLRDVTAEEQVRCHSMDVWIYRPIEMCSAYKLRNEPERWELEKIAWIIELKNKKIGFLRPGDERHKKILEA